MILENDRFTRLELHWLVNQYRKTLGEDEISDRTFRHWRKLLGILPDDEGYYWGSDLERLKALARGLFHGRTLKQITTELSHHAYAS